MVPTDDSVKGVIINPFGKLYPLGKEILEQFIVRYEADLIYVIFVVRKRILYALHIDISIECHKIKSAKTG